MHKVNLDHHNTKKIVLYMYVRSYSRVVELVNLHEVTKHSLSLPSQSQRNTQVIRSH